MCHWRRHSGPVRLPTPSPDARGPPCGHQSAGLQLWVSVWWQIRGAEAHCSAEMALHARVKIHFDKYC